MFRKQLTISQQLITAPSTALKVIWDSPSPWFPLFLVSVFSVLYALTLVNYLDFDAIRNLIIDPDISPLEQKQLRQSLSDNALTYTTVIGSIFSPLFLSLVLAVYLHLIGKALSTDNEFGEWFGLACWSQLPFVLGFMLSIIYLLLATPQISDLNASSLFSLYPYLPKTDNMVLNALYQISLERIWMWCLIALAFPIWTKRNSLVGIVVVIIALVIGIFLSYFFGDV